jgi:flagellar biosynthesis/type III secretory pathway M-ring protein FliF/YscJ
MDRLRQILAGIGKNLSGLKATQRLLVGALAVVVILALVVVALLAGQSSFEPIMPGQSAEDQTRAQSFLAGRGIDARMQGGQLVVPAAEYGRAVSMIAENNQFPSDKRLFFDTLIQSQSVFNSRQQNEQQFQIALMNELSRVISQFTGVKSATVTIDVPEAAGLGRQVKAPTASVAVTTSTGSAMPQSLVDAVAAAVEGSIAGLSRRNIQILDLAAGRARRPQGEEDVAATLYIEHATRIESETRRKIEDLLQHIPGVIVAVTAQVDVTRVTSQTSSAMPDKRGSLSLLRKETEEVNSSTEASKGSEPGPMSNQTADINRGGEGDSSRTESTTATREFENHVGRKTETVVDPKGYATRVAVSVNVPRGYVVRTLQSAAPPADAGAEPAEPTDEAIRAAFDTQIKRDIIESLRPHVQALMNTSGAELTEEQLRALALDSIGVSLIPVDLTGVGPGGTLAFMGAGSARSGSGLAGMLSGGMVQTAMLALLAVAALGMMFMMVRKASRQSQMPTAEELVGLPPTLEAQSDLIGEADESDTAMAGIEVDESALQSQKVLEQVGELVQKDPEVSARILNRWLTAEES